MDTYWLKQTKEKPLYPELIWSKPENKQSRGKLLIIGGNAHGFAAPGEAYRVAEETGAGTIRTLLPDALRRIFVNFHGPSLETEFAASNPSGSFSQTALGEWLHQTQWADGVLLAGDIGRNSETAIIFEKYLQKTSAAVTITKDAVDYFIPLASLFADRKETTLVLSMAQLQKLGMALRFEHAFKIGMDVLRLTETLHVFTESYGLEIVVKHLGTVFVAAGGRVSSTNIGESTDIWRVSTAAKCSVWRMQNPGKPFEALTTSLIT